MAHSIIRTTLLAATVLAIAPYAARAQQLISGNWQFLGNTEVLPRTERFCAVGTHAPDLVHVGLIVSPGGRASLHFVNMAGPDASVPEGRITLKIDDMPGGTFAGIQHRLSLDPQNHSMVVDAELSYRQFEATLVAMIGAKLLTITLPDQHVLSIPLGEPFKGAAEAFSRCDIVLRQQEGQ